MAYSITSLDILGHGRERVPNTFYAREGSAEEIGVLLPGIGYTAQMPLLWYARRLLQDRGADVLAVQYNYMTRPERRPSDPDLEERLRADVAAALKTTMQHRAYTHVTLVGKSLGTLAIGYLLAERIVEPRSVVWLTPLLKQQKLFGRMLRQQGRSLVVIGTADPHYDPELLRQLRDTTGSQDVVIDGADHSMEIEGDTVRSIRAMEQVVETVQRFLAG